MRRIRLIPGHYYIKLKRRPNPVLAFYSGSGIAPWSYPNVPYVGWLDIERVIN